MIEDEKPDGDGLTTGFCPIDLHIEAENPDTPVERLLELSRSSYQMVHEALARNPSLPEDIIEKYAEKYPECVIKNPKAPPSFLLNFAECGDRTAKIFAIQNPNAPKELYVRLMFDADEVVSRLAMKKLAKCLKSNKRLFPDV